MLALNAKCSIGDQLHPTGRLDQATYDLVGPVYREIARKEPWCRGARASHRHRRFHSRGVHRRAPDRRDGRSRAHVAGGRPPVQCCRQRDQLGRLPPADPARRGDARREFGAQGDRLPGRRRKTDRLVRVRPHARPVRLRAARLGRSQDRRRPGRRAWRPGAGPQLPQRRLRRLSACRGRAGGRAAQYGLRHVHTRTGDRRQRGHRCFGENCPGLLRPHLEAFLLAPADPIQRPAGRFSRNPHRRRDLLRPSHLPAVPPERAPLVQTAALERAANAPAQPAR